MKNAKEITKILQDHEHRLVALENKKKQVIKEVSWYKVGSTIDKIVRLISGKFFDRPKSLNEIISKLKEGDFHLKPSDLTLPLRKVVRKGLRRKTRQLADDTVSKKWLYVKA
jgi:hypothetical protein